MQALPSFAGKDPAKIRLYAADSGGTLQAIPFQVEPDSILWMASDMGPKVDPGKWPAAAVRLEVSLDAGGEKVAYLTWEENASTLSPRSYVRYDPALDQVETDAYRIGFLKSKPLIQDVLVLKYAQRPQDILDRFKVRLKLAIRNFFDFNFDEGEIDSRIGGIRAGPIRVLRTVSASKKIGPIKLIPKSRMDFFFYPDWVEVVSQVINPIDGPKILDEKTKGASGFDLDSAVFGSRFYSDQGGPLNIDGRPDPTETQWSGKPLRWWSLIGPAGILLARIQNDPKLVRLGIEPTFFLIDDAGKADPPESETGQIFVGFNVPYQRIPKGEYQVRVLQVFPKTSEPGEEEMIFKSAKTVAPAYLRPLP